LLRTTASLELLPVAEKLELGELLLDLIRRDKLMAPAVWSLGRLGARVPLFQAAHRVVPPGQAVAWIDELLERTRKNPVEGAAFALAQIARKSGDRTRDLDEQSSRKVAAALQELNARESWIRMVTELVQLDRADEARALGDTLPLGLQLVR
jgi:hypothetical protein